MSKTHRRATAARRRVAAAIPAFGLAAPRPVRCRHMASTGGPASAAAMINAASHQASCEAGPGVTRTAAPTAIAAAGSTATAPPARATAPTCRSDAPRARIMVNSVSRCSATSLAPSSTTIAAMIARLTNNSDSARCTASSVATNDGSVLTRPLLRLIVIVADWPAVALRLVLTDVAAGR